MSTVFSDENIVLGTRPTSQKAGGADVTQQPVKRGLAPQPSTRRALGDITRNGNKQPVLEGGAAKPAQKAPVKLDVKKQSASKPPAPLVEVPYRQHVKNALAAIASENWEVEVQSNRGYRPEKDKRSRLLDYDDDFGMVVDEPVKKKASTRSRSPTPVAVDFDLDGLLDD